MGERLQNKFLNYCNERETDWKFITPFSPWSNGVYTRLIGISKETMRKVTDRPSMHEDDKVTLVTEVEAIVNSRPLIQLNDDGDEVIRPIDFIIPEAKIGMPVRNDSVEVDEELICEA